MKHYLARNEVEYLCSVELRWGICVRIVGRNVDESVNVVFCNSFCDSFSSFNVYILEFEVPGTDEPSYPKFVLGWSILGRIIASNKVVDYIGMPDTLLQRLCISQIIFLLIISKSDQCIALWPSCRTINITLPKSPETFKCLLAISSRKGTITVHPCLAKPHNHQSKLLDSI